MTRPNICQRWLNCAQYQISPTFSVTANFVGKRNYTAPEVKDAVADGVTRQCGWAYADDDREADLNLRVFIEHDTALVGLRVAADPLHRRAYKQVHIPGALKPTVAAAMLQIAGVHEGRVVVDPFCGSGTIPIEAGLRGASGFGGDLEADALQGALQNAQAAQVGAAIVQWDVRTLPLRDQSVDAIVSNMPWGRQVQVDAQLSALYAAAFAEMHRVVVPGGSIVLLTTFPELLPGEPAQEIEISLFGQNPKILRFTAGDR